MHNTCKSSDRIKENISLHKDFWTFKNTKPVVGIFLGGWTPFKGCVSEELWTRQSVRSDDIRPVDFLPDIEKYICEQGQIEDDLVRALQPFASIPWMEAILGCKVRCSKPNLWADTISEDIGALPDLAFDPAQGWVQTYIEFLRIYKMHFDKMQPIIASILRGPSDCLAAILGDMAVVYAYTDMPEAVRHRLEQITGTFCSFWHYQQAFIDQFEGGYIIPQNEIWTPGPSLRLQEDASAMLSPAMYEQFLEPCDRQIAAQSGFTLFHLHTTSLFVVEFLLRNPFIKILQFSRDDGHEGLDDVLKAAKQGQRAGKHIVLRGRFTDQELNAIRQSLDCRGLCVHIVTSSLEQAKQQYYLAKNT